MTSTGLIILASLIAIAFSIYCWRRLSVILVPLLLGLSLSGCLSTSAPEPVVIKQTCELADLEPKPDIPSVTWITEGCSHYKCLDKENYENNQEVKRIHRTWANYCLGVYERAQGRFED